MLCDDTAKDASGKPMGNSAQNNQESHASALPYLLAVHVGAGFHSYHKEPLYRAVMKTACKVGGPTLESGGSALDAVRSAIRVLEDDPNTNAGLGSNLTWSGRVECDASVMNGEGSFGAVGAVHGLKNPVDAASLIAEESQTPLSCGRVRPMLLVAEGARKYAADRGLSVMTSFGKEESDQYLVTTPAVQAWAKYRKMVQEADIHTSIALPIPATTPMETRNDLMAQPTGYDRKEIGVNSSFDLRKNNNENIDTSDSRVVADGDNPRPGSSNWEACCSGSKRSRDSEEVFVASDVIRQTVSSGLSIRADADPRDTSKGYEEEEEQLLRDTVGCIAVDAWGRVAAGVSSGGLAIKHDGRVGEAAMFACGCWAQGCDLGSLPIRPRKGAKEGSIAREKKQVAVGLCSTDEGILSSDEDDSESEDESEDKSENDLPAVAVSVTGVGEAVSRALLARECATQLRMRPKEAVDQILSELLECLMRPGCASEPCDCGVLAVRVERHGNEVRCELAAAHTSPSMGIAYRGRKREMKSSSSSGPLSSQAQSGCVDSRSIVLRKLNTMNKSCTTGVLGGPPVGANCWGAYVQWTRDGSR